VLNCYQVWPRKADWLQYVPNSLSSTTMNFSDAVYFCVLCCYKNQRRLLKRSALLSEQDCVLSEVESKILNFIQINVWFMNKGSRLNKGLKCVQH
jgi:hypothetical protein